MRRTRFPTYLSKAKRGPLPDAASSAALISTTSRSSTRSLLPPSAASTSLVKIWHTLAVWLLLIVMNADAGTPAKDLSRGVAGALGEFLSIRRRIAAANPAVDADGRYAVRDKHAASGRGERSIDFLHPSQVCLGIGDRDTTIRATLVKCALLSRHR